MGLDSPSVAFLCGAKARGADFTHIATLGRQSFFPRPKTLRKVLSRLGIVRDARAMLDEHRYSEEFFRLLGAESVTAIDGSDYEGSEVVHDLNRPIPAELHERFTVVLDGGTIEHVFHAPTAFQSALEMVRVGGRFLQVNVANNFLGHGFWQFSPELLFRILSAENGFEIDAVLLHEVVPGGRWYRARDPHEVRSRVTLVNDSPVYILTMARKVARVKILATPPQQSDYVARWEGDADPLSAQGVSGEAHGRPHRHKGRAQRTLKELQRQIAAWCGASSVRRGFRKKFYRRVSEDQIVAGDWG